MSVFEIHPICRFVDLKAWDVRSQKTDTCLKGLKIVLGLQLDGMHSVTWTSPLRIGQATSLTGYQLKQYF